MTGKCILSKLLIVIFLFSIVSCSNANKSGNHENKQDSLAAEKTVQLSEAEKAELNRYFTAFSEIYLPSFSENKVPDSVLIQFGVYYNYHNHYKLFKQIAKGSKASLAENMVADTAFQFFGIKIEKHQAIQDIEYNKNNYFITNSSGESYRFSQIKELTESGNGVYHATLEIFNAGSGFTGDINASPESWKSTEGNEGIPVLEGKMKAKIRKITEQGKSRYILLEYLKN